MDSTQRRLARNYLIGTAVVLVPLALWMRAAKDDVEFCRRVLAGLARGRPSVERAIDWSSLNALGVAVGKECASFPQELDRDKCRETFVKGFALGFKRVEGDVHAFKRWRVVQRSPQATVVAADYPAKRQTLLFTIAATGPKKLQGLQWQ